VAARRGDEPEPEPFRPPAPEPTPRPAIEAAPVAAPPIPSGPSTAAVEHANETVIAARPPEPAPVPEPRPEFELIPESAPPARPSLPSVDPDATRLDGFAPQNGRFDPHRFALVVESEEGEERERFPLPAPMSTVGRQTDNPELASDVAITNAPHVSRRQLALVWAPRGEKVGFTVYNVGLNPLHVNDKEVAGANRSRGELKLEELMADHTEWVGPGTAMRIGEHGPVLRIEDLRAGAAAADEPVAEPAPEPEPEVEIDPDATRFG
jgi:hypothetical protein